jgi:hypothetical protein
MLVIVSMFFFYLPRFAYARLREGAQQHLPASINPNVFKTVVIRKIAEARDLAITRFYPDRLNVLWARFLREKLLSP